jgi:transcriptional pleiotropic repressor
MTNYLKITEKYRRIIADAEDIRCALDLVCKALSRDLGVGVAAVDKDGVLATHEGNKELKTYFGKAGDSLDEVLAKSLAELSGDLLAVPMNELFVATTARDVLGSYMAYVFLITVFGNRVGSLILYKNSSDNTLINDDGLYVCSFVTSLLGLVMWQIQSTDKREEERKREAVRVVTDSLSYSELMVLATIFAEFEDSEGIIVASRIADKEGITRSVIVNAIRKLESAGIIESRSLGMKGTYIKILNKYFVAEIVKIKKNN